MATVIGVRFKKAGKVYYFSPGEVWPAPGEFVIVETTRGIELGEVVTGAREVADEKLVAPLKNVIRKATDEDLQVQATNEEREKEAFQICVQKIEQHKLEMKLVSVEYTFDDSKIIFYFTANGRVDFRDLVKDLAGIFHMRIELRQIGVRDEAKMLGGLGACGRQICCGAFLGDFQPVSIKMAKEQNLSLNPTKISGQCGRLMCCLKYEQDYYEETLKKLPRVGKDIMTPDGVGIVTEINVLRERVKVRVKTGDDTFEIKEYELPDVRKLAPGEKALYQESAPKQAEQTAKQAEAKSEEEPKEEKPAKRYPRPKIVKTMNTDEYMEKYSGNENAPEDKEEAEENASKTGKKNENDVKSDRNEHRMRPRHRHPRPGKPKENHEGEQNQ
ncbi:MAG: stage 0 sporulation family protein [Clostridia bacterium]|nr:stage 0 sporulation family protein [Clostridia bacterium]